MVGNYIVMSGGAKTEFGVQTRDQQRQVSGQIRERRRRTWSGRSRQVQRSPRTTHKGTRRGYRTQWLDIRRTQDGSRKIMGTARIWDITCTSYPKNVNPKSTSEVL